MTRGSLRVGITIGLQSPVESLWSNGIKQNAVFLAETLRHCERVASVRLINTTRVPVTPAMPWDLARWPTASFAEAKDDIDVLIELGGQIDAVQTDHLHARGAKLVSYCCTTEYVLAMESVLFGRRLWGPGLFVNRHYDDIWVIPQAADISGAYFSGLRRRPVTVVPFVWDPVFLEERAKGLPDGGRYRPTGQPRRIAVMEPNIDVVKFCLYPILIAEEAYRARPDAIGLLQVANAERISRHSQDFIALMSQLDIVRDHKAVFVGRHDTPAFLARNTDIVVSHQWENPLNYFYFEVCWQGYPLVHNAHLCSELGYYYPDQDVAAGRAALLRTIDEHDLDHLGHRDRQRRALARYLPSNPDTIAAYDALLGRLFESGAASGNML
jgi:hypothetical protein